MSDIYEYDDMYKFKGLYKRNLRDELKYDYRKFGQNDLLWPHNYKPGYIPFELEFYRQNLQKKCDMVKSPHVTRLVANSYYYPFFWHPYYQAVSINPHSHKYKGSIEGFGNNSGNWIYYVLLVSIILIFIYCISK